MSITLRLKHWQVFLILMVGFIFSNLTWTNHDLFNLSINLVGSILFFLWHVAIGLELTEHLPPKEDPLTTLFIINTFVIIISMIVIIVFFDGYYSSNGLLGFLWVAYLIFALIQFFIYLSKALYTLEKENAASFEQYVGYFLLFAFWPIGIWWIQPKLNKIWTSNIEP